MKDALKLLHLTGLALFLGSILTFAVASSVPGKEGLADLALARRVISAGTSFLTLPGLGLLVGSGVGLVWGRARLLAAGWLRIMALAAVAIVSNAVIVVLPAVRAATALAQEGSATGVLPPGYARAYAVESAAGGINVALTLAAMAAGVWRRPGKKGDRPLTH